MKPLLNEFTRVGAFNYYTNSQRKVIGELRYIRKLLSHPPKTIKRIKGLYPSERLRKLLIAETMTIHKLEMLGIQA
jgi:hypothetical protein